MFHSEESITSTEISLVRFDSNIIRRIIMTQHQHSHQTGETVMETGHYIDADGDHIELTAGQKFPNCPKSGKSTSWKHEQ